MGLFSSSKSSTSNFYEANPLAVDEGIGIAAENSSVSVNVTDGGAVARALDSVDRANATTGAGFSELLATAGDLFNQGQGLIGQTQKAVADAYSQAQTDKAGTIDNRTLIALAAAAVVGLFLFNRKGA